MHRMLLIALVAALTLLPGTARAADVPADAVYSEHFIKSASPVPNDADPDLHADVLRPKNVPAGAKVPTVLTVSPYTNHATQNLADKSASDPGVTRKGPSSRFFDFVVNDAKLFSKGYAYVMVDLRGFGGSGGCNDWGGPGEQNDVKRAVEWVASQPWSNGKVALFGKSYDAWTGLMGLAQKPKGLAAVIAQEPVVDGYRYLYMNRVRFQNSVLTGTLFQAIDAHPGALNDSPEYQSQNAFANAVKPGCYAQNIANQNNDDPNTEFWKARNLIDRVKGSTTPTLFMQGFIESNTKPDAVFDLWRNLAGTEHQAWFGQWDHVRGYEKVGGKYATGRDTFTAEALRFLDEHLKGIEPSVQDPKITVQSAPDGKFRSEEQWPPADSRVFTSPIKGGSYVDDTENTGDGSGAGNGIWSVSQPLGHAAHLAGMPKLTVDVTSAVPRSNLVANVYDIAPNKKATLVSRGAYLLNGPGPVTFELYGQDWIFEKGHRVGVLLSSSNSEWFDMQAPTQYRVTVKGGTIALPFLAWQRRSDLSGGIGPTPPGGMQSLNDVKARAFAVPDAAFADGLAAFALPPALTERPAEPKPGVSAPSVRQAAAVAAGALTVAATVPQGAASKQALQRIKLRVKRLRGGRLLVTGTAPKGMKLTIRVVRGGKTVAKRRVTAKRGTFRLVVKKVRRSKAKYTIRATGKGVAGATRVR